MFYMKTLRHPRFWQGQEGKKNSQIYSHLWQ